MEAARELFQAQQESLQARTFKENLLLNLPVGVVVVDRRYDIQEINSAARRLLGIHTVAIGEDLLHLAQNVPNNTFRAAIDRAIREKRVTKLSQVQVPQMLTGEPTYLQIECYPQPQPDDRRDEAGGNDGANRTAESVLVVVVDVTEVVQSRREMEQGNASLSLLTEELQAANASLTAQNQETRRANASMEEAHRKAEEVAARHAKQVEMLTEENRTLNAEKQEMVARHAKQIEMLAEANGELLAANEEVTRANSELRSMLDEFLVTNQESQAAIEEVETLNEELQATNEELETLNEEMQATVEELNTSSADLAARGDELQALAQSLEVQKAQLEAILSGLADAVLVITPEGKTLLVNEAYKRLFAAGEDGAGAQAAEGHVNAGADNEVALSRELDGRTKVMTDEHLRPLLPDETPRARAARGEAFSLTFTLASPSGDERSYLEAIGQPVTGDNGEKWGVVVIRDITERSLRMMQEEFSSLASHELRTPLTSIKGYLQMLQKSLEGQEGSERQLKFVESALTQTNRLMRLIDDLLDVARLQSGKFSLRLEPLRLDTFLERTVEIAQLLSKEQMIQLTIGSGVATATAHGNNRKDRDGDDISDTGGLLLVNGDPTRLEQAVLNLVTNAITYAPGSARIDVRLCRAEGTATAMAEINVQDYGRGIAAKDLPEVFNRFYQVGQKVSSSEQGLGLGLFITRQIVEAHGGTISVESIEGEGTTFTIRLPLL